MNEDTIAGAVKKTGGKIRAAVDHAVGDTEGEMQGKTDQYTGAAQEQYGKAKDAIKKATNS